MIFTVILESGIGSQEKSWMLGVWTIMLLKLLKIMASVFPTNT